MREIKFRAVIPERNATITFTLQDLLIDKFSNREILWIWLNKGNQPDQFTGLKDKNGKEIYEGDIVQFPSGGYFRDATKVKIEPTDGIVFWGFIDSKGENCGFGEEIETEGDVIGNIHDNPELLKEAKND